MRVLWFIVTISIITRSGMLSSRSVCGGTLEKQERNHARCVILRPLWQLTQTIAPSIWEVDPVGGQWRIARQDQSIRAIENQIPSIRQPKHQNIRTRGPKHQERSLSHSLLPQEYARLECFGIRESYSAFTGIRPRSLLTCPPTNF
jgi:hypothetical protein